MGTISVTPSGQACGATVTGVDLTQALSDAVIKEIRDAWLEHHVLSFPDQVIDDDQFERFALRFGVFGDDGFFGPIEGREHIAAIRREAEDTQSIFADMWHSDWSSQEDPPAATFLYSLDIPPVGGDTLFVNKHLALEEMPSELRAKLEGKTAIHSAVLGYAPDGPYGDPKRRGSMDIRPSDEAYKRRPHPLIPRMQKRWVSQMRPRSNWSRGAVLCKSSLNLMIDSNRERSPYPTDWV